MRTSPRTTQKYGLWDTLTADWRSGDETQLRLKLQNLHISPDDLRYLTSSEKLLEEFASRIKKERTFSSPKEQVDRFLTLNELIWKRRDINTATVRIPEVVVQDLPLFNATMLTAPTLLYHWGSEIVTLGNSMEALSAVVGRTHLQSEDGLPRDFFPLREEDSNFTIRSVCWPKTRPKGPYWASVEFGRTHRKLNAVEACLSMDRTCHIPAGAELPLIAAMHPKWALWMDGETYPYVLAPGAEITVGGSGPFVLRMCFGHASVPYIAIGAISVGWQLSRYSSIHYSIYSA